MKLIFSEQAWEDYLHWQKTDKKMIKRINTSIKDSGDGEPRFDTCPEKALKTRPFSRLKVS